MMFWALGIWAVIATFVGLYFYSGGSFGGMISAWTMTWISLVLALKGEGRSPGAPIAIIAVVAIFAALGNLQFFAITALGLVNIVLYWQFFRTALKIERNS